MDTLVSKVGYVPNFVSYCAAKSEVFKFICFFCFIILLALLPWFEVLTEFTKFASSYLYWKVLNVLQSLIMHFSLLVDCIHKYPNILFHRGVVN